jgi:hypothetical protein
MIDSDDNNDEKPAEQGLLSRAKRGLRSMLKWLGFFAIAAIVYVVVKTFEVPETIILWVLVFTTYAVLQTKIEDLQSELSCLKGDIEDVQELHPDQIKNIHKRLHRLDPAF